MKVRLLFTLLLPLLASTLTAPVSAQTSNLTEVVCMDTSVGEFCLRLFPEDAPQTVANFLNYVNSGAYDNTIIHRSVPDFVIQGGGYFFNSASGQLQEIAKGAAVVNEFKRSNVRGTIAMAKFDGEPNSATSEWFINMNNNGGGGAQLDSSNGGFTVFGEVVLNGMNVMEAMQFFEPRDARGLLGNVFAQIPLVNFVTAPVTADNFLKINRAYVTQRDLSILGFYESKSFAVPIRMGDKIYRIIFRQTSEPPVYVFQGETFSIVEHKDVGQQTAVLNGDVLTIPSLGVGDSILTDIVLRMTNRATLEFTLESFNRKP
jgi:peptidyl-prolyl cis-trans isomerase A (cyclophilin A)